MKENDFKSLSVDELWEFREKIAKALAAKMVVEQRVLADRLRQLNQEEHDDESSGRRKRHYPAVFPKYRNPNEPSETWAGRGKQPRWLTA